MNKRGPRVRAAANLLLVNKSPSVQIQFLRYGVVAVVALAVDFGLLAFSKEVLGMHYLLAAMVGFIAGLITNFILSVSWVFHHQRPQNRKYEMAAFAVIGAVGLAATELLMWTMVDGFDINYIIGKAITTVLVYFWNFFARKFLIYNQKGLDVVT